MNNKCYGGYVMKIENLYEGQIIKNYRELCRLIGEKVADGGHSKMCQMREFERYVKYHKEGNKLIIDEIYDEPKEKIDGRGKKCRKEIESYKIPRKLDKHYGIYKIELGNKIYIGSTVQGFRRRFMGHYNGGMKHTYDLIVNGGEFDMLLDMTDIEDVELIRMVEDAYIGYYRLYTNYDVINTKEASSHDKRRNDIKKRRIFIDCNENDLELIKELLEEKGYNVY